MSISKSPEQRFVIDFWVTGQCNMSCQFCYGADVPKEVAGSKFLYRSSENRYRPELSLDQAKDILLKFKEIGATTIVFSGGEPLIRRDIVDLIKFTHDHFETYISTNGTLFFEKYAQIYQNIDSLSLALDGSNNDMSVSIGRDINHVGVVKGILEYFKDHPPNHTLKVGTMVSQINKNDIMKIGEFLFKNSKFYKPDAWRLYQFAPHRGALSQRARYEIDTDEFLKICDFMQKAFSDVVYISERTAKDLENAYFFITPDGLLQVSDEQQYRTITDLLTVQTTDLIKILSHDRSVIQKSRKNREWRKFVDSGLDTDPLDSELLDIVDDHDRIVGQANRVDVYQSKKQARVVNIFLENTHGQIWVTRRNPQKNLYPLCFDNSAGGHVKSGEDYDDAFRREVREELDIDVSQFEWELMGYLTPKKNKVSTFMKVYKVKTNTPPNFNRDDFVEGFWMKPSELMALITSGEPYKDDLILLLQIFYAQ